ncbi:MAG: CHAP domain-containing protein [Candidatus Fimenecus sp.]
MPDIKTRIVKSGTVKTFNGTVKTFDRSVRTGDEFKKSTLDNADKVAPDNAPANLLQSGELYAGKKAVDSVVKSSSALIRSPYRSYRAVGRSIQAKEKTKASVKTAKQTIKTSKDAVKKSLKSIQSSIKTAKNTVKTANTAVKTTSKVSKTSYTAAKNVAKAVYEGTKVTAKATIEVVKVAVKVAVDIINELVAAIVAGGWVAVLAILIIILAIVLCSCFAVFLTQHNEDNNLTMPTVIQNIDTEYATKISDIISSNPVDNVEMAGSRAVWNEVLSVYAVIVNYDETNPQEVATLDENKIDILSSIFWEMNIISYETETKTVTVITETDDGNGNIIQTETEEEQSFLYITSTHKTAVEMASQYGFSKEQNDALTALLAPENADLWSAVIYGTFNSSSISDVARTQIGNFDGTPYWSWYGFDSRVEWCACFVSWCADQCGYIETGIIPKYASCAVGIEWFKSRSLWKDNFYIPRQGDIIFFDWADGAGVRDGICDHTGIVESVDSEYIYTIEGNSGNMVRRNKYLIGSADIYGYGVPMY